MGIRVYIDAVYKLAITRLVRMPHFPGKIGNCNMSHCHFSSAGPSFTVWESFFFQSINTRGPAPWRLSFELLDSDSFEVNFFIFHLYLSVLFTIIK
jgi:hypothetical protein